MPLHELVLVDSPESLRKALTMLHDLPVVGVDVERADWDRYYRAAATVQVGGDGRVAVVDPLALSDLTPLHDFLDGRMTVFHALENDLEPIVALGVSPTRVADTAVAAAVLGLPTGLERLLHDLLGVELSGDKAAMQRADWEARPLTPQMLSYAAGDVADLPALWAALSARLDAGGRRDWYLQELAATLALPPVEQRRDWTKTKGAGRMEPAARARLRALWQTREELARSTDTAPGRIAGDAVLVDLATTPPAHLGELGRRGVRRRAARDFGKQLLAAMAAADAAPVEPRAPRRSGRATTDADRALIEQLRQLRASRARALGIEAGVLCPSRTLAGAVLSDPPDPPSLRASLGMRPWQWEQLGAAFCDAMDLDGPGKPPPVGDDETETTAPMADLLNPDALHHGLAQLHGWSGTTEGLTKAYRFSDRTEAESFVQRVAVLADEMDHHPGVDVDGDTVRLSLVTHSAGGVTQSDLDLAARIDTGEAHGDANLDNPAAGETSPDVPEGSGPGGSQPLVDPAA